MHDDDRRLAITAADIGAVEPQRWFEALHTAFETESGSWEGFLDALRTTGPTVDTGIDDRLVDDFAETMRSATDPLRAMGELAQRPPSELADERSAYPVETEPEATGFEWVPTSDRATLEAALGDSWPHALATTFDEVWPGWESADDDTRTAALTDWLPTILYRSGHEQPEGPISDPSHSSATTLAWVGPMERARIIEVTGAATWTTTVTETFDEVWPGWREADDATKSEVLAEWLPTILDRAASPDTGAPAEPEFAWVTGTDRAALEGGLGARWPDAVRATFDEAWPGWESAEDEVKATTLTAWTPTILGAGAPAEPSADSKSGPATEFDDVVAPAPVEVATAVLDRDAIAIAAAAVTTTLAVDADEDMLDELARIDPAELRELLDDVLDEALQEARAANS